MGARLATHPIRSRPTPWARTRGLIAPRAVTPRGLKLAGHNGVAFKLKCGTADNSRTGANAALIGSMRFLGIPHDSQIQTALAGYRVNHARPTTENVRLPVWASRVSIVRPWHERIGNGLLS